MQDLKTGHLLGAAPKAQFWGQVIGATVGAVLSALIYRLYTAVYEIPGELFQVPTAYVWIFTARLVTGKGLPPMVKEWAIGAGVLFAVTTLIRTFSVGKAWRSWVPGGIAVAVGTSTIDDSPLGLSTDVNRNVQCAVVHTRASDRGHFWMVLGKRDETLEYTPHHSGIGMYSYTQNLCGH